MKFYCTWTNLNTKLQVSEIWTKKKSRNYRELIQRNYLINVTTIVIGRSFAADNVYVQESG